MTSQPGRRSRSRTVARLAGRMEISHAVLALVQRLPGLHLASDELVYKDQLHLHGLERLPVDWQPAPARDPRNTGCCAKS